jgi:hypothetical protein
MRPNRRDQESLRAAERKAAAEAREIISKAERAASRNGLGNPMNRSRARRHESGPPMLRGGPGWRIFGGPFALLKDALIAICLTLIAFRAFRLIDFLGVVLKSP